LFGPHNKTIGAAAKRAWSMMLSAVLGHAGAFDLGYEIKNVALAAVVRYCRHNNTLADTNLLVAISLSKGRRTTLYSWWGVERFAGLSALGHRPFCFRRFLLLGACVEPHDNVIQIVSPQSPDRHDGTTLHGPSANRRNFYFQCRRQFIRYQNLTLHNTSNIKCLFL
jgi:hypothetical protein